MSRDIEEWKPIEGYEGLYEVSDWGNVRSLDRVVEYANGRKHFHKGKIVNLSITTDGYYRCHLSKNGKVKIYSVHRLVAEAFIPNPDNLPEINHKDENPQNNKSINLEWCDRKYNNTYNDRHLKCAHKIKKANQERSGKIIHQYTLDGELVATYPSTWEASKQTNFTKQGIMICCHGGQMRKGKWVKTLQYKGYIWKYAST